MGALLFRSLRVTASTIAYVQTARAPETHLPASRIEGQLPGTWQELEAVVGHVLAECGFDVEVQKNVKLAPGDVDIDIRADDHSSPTNVIAIECKRWKASVPKNLVHAFRAVVGDSDANTGLLISAAGFQDGAVETRQYSNVRLLTRAG